MRPVQYPQLPTDVPLVDQPVLDVDQYNALRVADAYACVRLLADTVATLPVRALRGTAEVGPDALISRLLARPAPGNTSSDLFSAIMVSLNTTGNAYIGKFRGPDGQIAMLDLIDPNTVQVERRGLRVIYRVWLPSQDTTEFGPEDILHIKAMTGLDGLHGLSPVTQARLALTLNANLQESSRQYFSNGSKPSGVLTVSGPQSDFSIEKIREQWDKRHRGTENMHRVAVLTGEAKFTPLGFSLDDSQFLQQRELSTREVARIFRVPAFMLDAETANARTYMNVTQQNLHFVQHSLRPWLTRIERAFTQDADLCLGQLSLEFDLDGLLRGDPDLRTTIYQRALGDAQHPGWMSREEVRALESLSPNPNGAILEPANKR